MRRILGFDTIKDRLKRSYNLSSDQYKNHWEKLFTTTHIDKLTSNIINLQLSNKWEYPPPHPDIETTPDLIQIFDKIKIHLIPEENDFVAETLAFHLEEFGGDILLLLGQRLTPSSIRNYKAIPPLPDTLLSSATKPYNEKLTEITRAWSKHAFSCKSNYWPEVSGSWNEKNATALELIQKLIEEYTWWNVFGHFKHDMIFEIRDRSGHGARWEHPETKFIGLIEPIDPGSGQKFVN